MHRLLIFIFIAATISASGQSVVNSTDSLTLNEIIKTVVANHPLVKQGEEAVNAASYAVSMSKTGYYPNIDASASFTRLGPIDEISIPHLGSFEMYPANNYSFGVSLSQNIYDFGRTCKNVAVAKESKNISKQSLEQLKQKLAIACISHYYTILYLQQAIRINQEEQKNLKAHLDFLQKKNETGSATQYEIISTKVKSSTIQNAGFDLETTLTNQIIEMKALMGQPKGGSLTVKNDLDIKYPAGTLDSLVSYALSNRDEMILAHGKKNVAELRYKAIKTQYYPSLNLYASGGAKNGYFPDLKVLTANYTAGVGLRIPIFDGLKTRFSLLSAKSGIQAGNDEINVAALSVISEVSQSLQTLGSSQKKIEQYTIQTELARQAYTLALTNYQAGSITNIEVLDATTAVSESMLLLYKSKIEYIVNVYKLKAAIGERLY